MKKVKVISEKDTGRNMVFQDTRNNHIMSINEFVSRIKDPNSAYSDDYYVRKINGIDTPVSKPNGKIEDNLE